MGKVGGRQLLPNMESRLTPPILCGKVPGLTSGLVEIVVTNFGRCPRLLSWRKLRSVPVQRTCEMLWTIINLSEHPITPRVFAGARSEMCDNGDRAVEDEKQIPQFSNETLHTSSLRFIRCLDTNLVQITDPFAELGARVEPKAILSQCHHVLAMLLLCKPCQGRLFRSECF